MEIHGVRPAILSLFAAKFTPSIPGSRVEECRPIIIRDANKALHLIFPATFTDLTRVKWRLDLFPDHFLTT